MSPTPNTRRILTNDYWCFYLGLFFVLLIPIASISSVVMGHARLSGLVVPVLLPSMAAVVLIVVRVRWIRRVLETGRSVKGFVESSFSMGFVGYLHARYHLKGKTWAKRWLLKPMAGRFAGRVEVRVDPERPRRAYPVAPFCGE